MRVNLIAYTKSLSDFSYQREYWGKSDPNNSSFYDNFDESIHFLYDTMDIENEPESWLGLVLKDDKEVFLIEDLNKSISHLFRYYGLNMTDKQYMATEEWKLILKSAKALYDELISDTNEIYIDKE